MAMKLIQRFDLDTDEINGCKYSNLSDRGQDFPMKHGRNGRAVTDCQWGNLERCIGFERRFLNRPFDPSIKYRWSIQMGYEAFIKICHGYDYDE